MLVTIQSSDFAYAEPCLSNAFGTRLSVDDQASCVPASSAHIAT